MNRKGLDETVYPVCRDGNGGRGVIAAHRPEGRRPLSEHDPIKLVPSSCRRELELGLRTFEQMDRYAKFPARDRERIRKLIDRHPVMITPYYASLIDWSDPNDPIRRMAVPSVDEMNLEGSFDTSGELDNTKIPGLQHKYGQTALILSTNRCAMYCRHCFRKRLVGLTSQEILRRFGDGVAYIRQHEEINNVLVSGGDPLVLPTEVIAEFVRQLSGISHLRFIRFGSRVPVTFPQRILDDPGLTAVLGRYSRDNRRVYIVSQFNHPREITDLSAAVVSRLIRMGVPVNNQTVLLRGVNDDPDVMAELQNGLVGMGVQPYYVFQCRPVKRVKHSFQVPLRRGYEIIERAKRQLNGLSKRFRFVMSHRTGKIEIVGVVGDEIYLKYHQAKEPKHQGLFFKRRLTEGAAWLDDLKY